MEDRKELKILDVRIIPNKFLGRCFEFCRPRGERRGGDGTKSSSIQSATSAIDQVFVILLIFTITSPFSIAYAIRFGYLWKERSTWGTVEGEINIIGNRGQWINVANGKQLREKKDAPDSARTYLGLMLEYCGREDMTGTRICDDHPWMSIIQVNVSWIIRAQIKACVPKSLWEVPVRSTNYDAEEFERTGLWRKDL